MLSAPRSRAEQLIYQRRAQEEKLVNMQTKLKQEFHHSEFANWQNKGKQIEITNQVKQKLAQLRQQAQGNLNHRRYLPLHPGKNLHNCWPKRTPSTNSRSSICSRPLSRSGSVWPSELAS